MKKQFVTYEIALKLKELGFDEECFAYYNKMGSFVDEDGSIYKKSKVLFLEYDNQFNQISPLWFEKDIIKEMWDEGSYWDGEHSRCKLVGNDVKAPLWQQAQSFLDDNEVIIGIIFVDNVFKYTLNTDNYVSNGFKDRTSAIKSATEHATNYLWNKKFNK